MTFSNGEAFQRSDFVGTFNAVEREAIHLLSTGFALSTNNNEA